MKKSMMLSLLVVVFVILIPVVGGCNSGPEPGDQNSYSQVFSSVSFTGSEEVSAAIDELVRESKIAYLRPGVWVVNKIIDGSRTETLPVPIEIIVDPVVAARVKNALRPDGGLMYSYPESLPEGYSKELFEYSIDIYSEKIPAGQGVEGGKLILYGHFVNPPYKYQVVVVGPDDVRTLVNGIDTKLPRPKQGREENKRKAKRISIHSNAKRLSEVEYKRIPYPPHIVEGHHAKLIGEILYPVVGAKNAAEVLQQTLKAQPYIFGVEIKKLSDEQYCIHFESKIDRSKPMPDIDHPYKKYDIKNYEPHIVCIGKSPLPTLSTKQRIEDAIRSAGTRQNSLAMNHFDIDFGGTGLKGSGMEWEQVSTICRSAEPNKNIYIDDVRKILGTKEMALYLLANCAR
jgi:hypothetical protein